MVRWSLGAELVNAYLEKKKPLLLVAAAAAAALPWRFLIALSMPWSSSVAHGAHLPLTSNRHLHRGCWKTTNHNWHIQSCSYFLQNMVMIHNNYNSEEHERDVDDRFISQEQEQKLEIEEVNEITGQSTNSLSRVDDIWMNSKHKRRGWFRGQSLASLLRQHKVKKKEENRLHTANVQAAISITQLAAAIAGYAANGCIGPASKDDMNAAMKGGAVASVKNMDNIVATAAALLATVCAETAESVGAHTSRVASAINSGLACQTTADMVTLVATTATCLRGVTALKSRAMENAYSLRNQEELAVKAQLSIVTPSGHRRQAWVSIYSKHNQLILSLQIKYLGIIARTKEYKILHAMEKNMESQGQGHSITVKSHVGNIMLVFKDENQSLHWISSISNLLKTHS
ncbi:hypothetical protein FNV43_RR23800 [Rhamnella rubrinervis]|uniref:VAN3-binding protein-like auxin canalisation domain-containing protein n=1 Tax=Rhamnella rubrinervis TaxID=2594499 RepID=A0A8K0DPE3_9ROSA|nr:hypothetical protein FNV43_RR23800 [Rhamnella rubrinervis]